MPFDILFKAFSNRQMHTVIFSKIVGVPAKILDNILISFKGRRKQITYNMLQKKIVLQCLFLEGTC